jgi:transposase InsO family protein
MNVHQNARLTPLSRADLVRRVLELGQPAGMVAFAFGICAKTVRKWVGRFQTEGSAGLADRSSRPSRLDRPTPPEQVETIIALRRQRLCGNHIAAQAGVSPATVSRVLQRAGLARLRDLEPAEAVQRYQYAEPGGLIHLDIKTLGRFEQAGHRVTGDRRGQSNSRGIGWEYVHVGIDDASRLAFTAIHDDQKATSAVAFLTAAIAYYNSLGITVTRVMTDNGSCYKAHAFAQACQALGVRHIRTRPFTPKTNGKAERFIQTSLREWAYARTYTSSAQRARHLPEWTHMSNWHRPHGSINSKPPISVLDLPRDNLLRLHS